MAIANRALSRRALFVGAEARPQPAPQIAATIGRPATAELRMVFRATMGFTVADHAEVQARGVYAWRDWQLNPLAINDAALDARLATLPALGMTGSQLLGAYSSVGKIPGENLKAAGLLRAVFSRRQLFERVVWFLNDHLSISLNGEHTRLLKVVDDRDVVRQHALGPFRTLLHASAKSASMLSYLTNDTNVVGQPNENYARELMELHTLGVDGPYTETDVREVARCFTGWTFDTSPANYGRFVFDSAMHDNGQKVVLGTVIPAGGGVTDGERVLDMLAAHPKTASYISGKLCRWFLRYDPPAWFVARIAGVWRRTSGDIREVVRAILSPRGLRLVQPKVKRPFHYAVSLFRAMGDTLPLPWDAAQRIDGLGQPLFEWPAPDGYPDAAGPWAGNMLPRWQFASNFVHGWDHWSSTTEPHLNVLVPAPRAQWAADVGQLLNGGVLTENERAEAQAVVDGVQWPAARDIAEAFELIASGPTLQHY